MKKHLFTGKGGKHSWSRRLYQQRPRLHKIVVAEVWIVMKPHQMSVKIGSKNMRRSVDTASIPPVVLYDSIIPWSPVINDLGLHINSTHDWRA